MDECDVNVPVSISELDWFRSGEEKEKGRNFASAESGHFRGMRVCVSVCQQLVKLVRCAALTRVTCTLNLSVRLPCCRRPPLSSSCPRCLLQPRRGERLMATTSSSPTM